jgi:hypothetical protein
LHLCQILRQLKNLRALEIHQETFGNREGRATQIAKDGDPTGLGH